MPTDFNERQQEKKISKEAVAIVALIAIGIIIVIFCVKEGLHAYKINKIKSYAEDAGLTNISVNVNEYRIRIRCDNFKGLEWDTLMTMDQNIADTLKNLDIVYVSDKFDYYISRSRNQIIATSYDTRIEYNGEWGSRKNINLETERAAQEERRKRTEEVLNKIRDDAISNSTCCICGKQATERIDKDYYCTKHYNEAAEWYIKKAAQKLIDGE